MATVCDNTKQLFPPISQESLHKKRKLIVPRGISTPSRLRARAYHNSMRPPCTWTMAPIFQKRAPKQIVERSLQNLERETVVSSETEIREDSKITNQITNQITNHSTNPISQTLITPKGSLMPLPLQVGGQYPQKVRDIFSKMYVLKVPSENCGEVFNLVASYFGKYVIPSELPSGRSVIRMAIERGILAETDAAVRLTESVDIWVRFCFFELKASNIFQVGADATSTYYDRCFLEIQFGGVDKQGPWYVTHSIKESVRGAEGSTDAICEAWRSIQERQASQHLSPLPIYKIEGIVFDNCSENRGATSGVAKRLNAIRHEAATKDGTSCDDLMVKGCSDHITALILKDWENKIAKLYAKWNWTQFSTPSKNWKLYPWYLMYRISKRFRTAPWKTAFEAFCAKFGTTVQVVKVSRVRYATMELQARVVIQNLRLFYLWYRTNETLLTEKDRKDFEMLQNPDVLLILIIAAVGFQKFFGPFMSFAAQDHTASKYSQFVQNLTTATSVLLCDAGARQHFLTSAYNSFNVGQLVNSLSPLCLPSAAPVSTQESMTQERPLVSASSTALHTPSWQELGPLRKTQAWEDVLSTDLYQSNLPPDLVSRAHIYLATLCQSTNFKLLMYDSDFLCGGRYSNSLSHLRSTNRSGESQLGKTKADLNRNFNTRSCVLTSVARCRTHDGSRDLSRYASPQVLKEARETEARCPTKRKRMEGVFEEWKAKLEREQKKQKRKDDAEEWREFLKELYQRIAWTPKKTPEDRVDTIKDCIRHLKQKGELLRLTGKKEDLVQQLKKWWESAEKRFEKRPAVEEKE